MVTKFLNIDTDNTLSANSNERVPSQKAVKTYTDNLTTSKQNKVLDTPITVGSTEETTIEGALGAINTSLSNKQNQSLSSAITVDGTQQTTVEGTLNALNIYANSKQNNLTAGDNITINNNVISAKDTTYIAGTGIAITEDSDENLVISSTQSSAEWGNITGTLSNQTDLQNTLNTKQDTLVSGTNIKTVNGNSLLGSGNVDIDALPSQTGQSGKFLTTDGTNASWAVVQSSGSGKNIGEVYFSESSSAQDNTGGLPLFTGETIVDADQVYPDFYDWVLAHTSLQISAAGYETALTTYGECPKYVIDDINKTIRLPKLVNYIKMANTTDGISQNAAGLPNITGTVGTQNWQTTTIGPVPSIGALSGSNDSNSANTGGSGTGAGTLNIDASLSNPIYGNSNTVTPAHTTLFPWVWAYNVAIPASTAQAAEFQNALTGKADVDLGNLTDTGKIKVAHLAMPGDEYVDLTLGASGATYTAPADGYVCIRKLSNAASQILSIYNISNGMQQSICSAGANQEMALVIPVQKGHTFGIWYSLGGATQLFRFVYAKGAEN